jgi:hypothetical protein
MNVPTATAICIFALIVAISIFSGYRRASVTSGPWPFYLKRILTQPEQVLYHRLVKALPNHIVLAQVQVSRVLGVKRGSRFHEWNNRVSFPIRCPQAIACAAWSFVYCGCRRP